MVSVGADEERVRRMIGEDLSIAAVNGPEQVVLSGREKAIEKICRQMTKDGIEHRRVQIEVAAHSRMVEGILDRFEKYVKEINKSKPTGRFISNVSGKWITAEEAIDAGYWRRQLRECVRFSDGVKELLTSGAGVMVEVGPGQTLQSLVKMNKRVNQIERVIGTLKHPQEEQDEREDLTRAIGNLWMGGVEIDWSGYYKNEKRTRVGLPTYPFERQKYWIEAGRESGEKRRSKPGGKN